MSRRAMLVAALAISILPMRMAFAGEDQTLYNNGRSAIFEERWADARNVFEEMNRRFPTSPLADDAHYWLGMALYEMSEAEGAYAVLQQMTEKYPSSPWSDDARALRVRCAELAMRDAAANSPGASSGGSARPKSEYATYIEKSTRDVNSRVQLLAIDTVLETNPGRAPELLPRLNNGGKSREAAGLVVDRFFSGERVKVTMENPLLGLRDGNVAIMVRQDSGISYLSLAEATDLIRDGGSRGAGGAPARFDAEIVSEIREKLLKASRNLVREGDPGSIETPLIGGGSTMSAIVKVVDGEVHYYRNGDEVVRIVVLKRESGFTDENVRIFLENNGSVRSMRIADVRALPSGMTRAGMTEPTSRYLKAALAIIEIDLTRAAESAAR